VLEGKNFGVLCLRYVWVTLILTHTLPVENMGSLCISQDTQSRNAVLHVFLERNLGHISPATPAR
jgi:hypothetical protein